MKKVDYFSIIHKYFDCNSLAYKIYLPHVVLVTNKALKIATRLNLSQQSIQFIEEVGMLHDIGSIRVHVPELGLNGTLPYIAHGLEGGKILRAEGLSKHALAVERHIGVGIGRQEVVKNHLPLPPKDMIPQTIEEEIVSYADLFFSKSPGHLWIEKSIEEVSSDVARFGKEKVAVFNKWVQKFGV